VTVFVFQIVDMPTVWAGHLVGHQDVKHTYIGSIEQRLDSLLQQGSSYADDDIDRELFSEVNHDYRSSSSEQCIHHYLSCYVARKMRQLRPAETAYKYWLIMSERRLTPSTLC